MESDPLDGRVARWGELRGNDALLLDTAIPGFARTIWSVIGRNVGEDRGERPPIAAEDFHLAVIRASPGNGTALHDHTTVEVFMPLTGRWLVLYGAGGARELVLEQWDVCSVPAGVWRGFRNVSGEDAYLLAVIGGTDAGRITWAPAVLEEAARHGRTLDDEGYLEPGSRSNPGYVVDVDDVEPIREGARAVSVQVTIDASVGSERLTQRLVRFGHGRSGARSPGAGMQEILYVASGCGTLRLGGDHPLEPDTAAYVLPDDTYEIENPGPGELVVVSVLAPLDRTAEGLGPDRQVVVRFRDRPTIPVGGPREFRYLVNEELGALDVTQFLGLVQPSRAPVHDHEYDEVAFIVEGEGTIHMGDIERPVGPGTCILFPRGTPHCLESSGPGVLRVMCVFYPSGSPGVHYVSEDA